MQRLQPADHEPLPDAASLPASTQVNLFAPCTDGGREGLPVPYFLTISSDGKQVRQQRRRVRRQQVGGPFHQSSQPDPLAYLFPPACAVELLRHCEQGRPVALLLVHLQRGREQHRLSSSLKGLVGAAEAGAAIASSSLRPAPALSPPMCGWLMCNVNQAGGMQRKGLQFNMLIQVPACLPTPPGWQRPEMGALRLRCFIFVLRSGAC